MAFDGSGVFVRPPAPIFPAVPNEVILAERFNANFQELFDALQLVLCRDGQSTVTGNINFNGNRITNLATALVAGNAVEYQQFLDALVSPDFTAPTADTAPATDDSRRLVTSEWVRGLLAGAAALNLPAISGQVGSLSTDGTTVEWRNAVPDFILMEKGIA